MANSIKGLTIEIGGDATGLSTAMRKADKEIRQTQNDLKEVEKSLKLDPTNTELLAQKQKLLAQAVEQAANKVEQLRAAQEKANEQLAKGEIGERQYEGLTRELVNAEAALNKAEAAAANFNPTLAKIGNTAGVVAEKTKLASQTAGALLAGMTALALKTAKEADELNTLAQQTGLTTDQLQKMQYASELVDVSMEAMAGAQSKLKKSLGSNEALFNQLGVATRDLNGELRDSDQVFFDTLEALSRVGNETERDQLAMQIFGRSADQLAGIIDDGGAALKAYGDEAERLGLIMDQETLDSLNKVNDEIDKLKATAKGELAKTGAKALEALTPVIETVIDALSKVLEVIGNLTPGTIEMIAIIAGIVAAISPLASAISAVLDLMPAIQAAMASIMTFATAHPLGLIIAAVAALTAIIIANWDKIKPVLDKVWEKVKDVFESIKDGITAAADWVKEKVNVVIAWINSGIEAINSLIEKVNGSWLGQQLGLNIGTVGTIDSLQTSSDKAALLQGGQRAASTTSNAYNTTNVYNQTSTQPLQVNLNMDGQTLARQMVQPMRAANALAGGTNMR